MKIGKAILFDFGVWTHLDNDFIIIVQVTA